MGKKKKPTKNQPKTKQYYQTVYSFPSPPFQARFFWSHLLQLLHIAVKTPRPSSIIEGNPLSRLKVLLVLLTAPLVLKIILIHASQRVLDILKMILYQSKKKNTVDLAILFSYLNEHYKTSVDITVSLMHWKAKSDNTRVQRLFHLTLYSLKYRGKNKVTTLYSRNPI